MNRPDEQKPRPCLLPWDAIYRVMLVMEYGARKHSEHGWRSVPDARLEYTNAAMRHMMAHLNGEEIDSESGLEHLALAAADILIAMES